MIIDANSLLHRAWHALPPMTAPDGRLVNAAYGFTSVLMKILQAERPDYLVVCWDTAAPTFRHTAAPEYKAQREEQPQEFYDQVGPAKQVVEAFGGTNVELDGYEADDLIGTLAPKLARAGAEVAVMTSDRDVWQIIGPHVKVTAFKKGVSETVVYDERTLPELTGLQPSQVADFKALRGDASDNLKGVPGIGEKTATELIRKYHDFSGIFAAAHDPESGMSDAVRKKLVAGEQAAKDTLPLVRLVVDAPIGLETEDLVRRPADQEAIKVIFGSLGFKSLADRLGGKPKGAEVKGGGTGEGHPRIVADGAWAPDVATRGADQVLREAGQEGELIIHLAASEQSSLFSEMPELAVGSRNSNALVTVGDLDKGGTAQALRSLMESAYVVKVGHGLKEVWHWADGRGWQPENLGFDVEIAAYLLAAGEGGHDLESLASARLGKPLPEGDGRPLAAVDAVRALKTILAEELERENLKTVYLKFEAPLIPILGSMERCGILVDKRYFKGLAKELGDEKRRLEKDMVGLAGEEFNPASPNQLSHILFEVLGLPTKGIKRGKTGISTAASELEKLEGAHPIIAKIGEYRETSKLLSTYVEAIPALADGQGRVHTTFNQTVTSTGRLSSSNPNLQNIPIRTALGRRIRRGFTAKPGFELLSCDYSQIELRIVAALADDRRMLAAFRDGADIHTATAAAIWHVAMDQVDKDMRRAAKAINFGIIYGQGPQGLAKAAGIGFEEARHFIDEYFMNYSGIKEYLEQTKALAHARGCVETLFGRRRPLPDINSPRPEIRAAAERMAINTPVQGTAADIIKLAMVKVAEALPAMSPASNLLLQVHDELVFEVPAGEAGRLAAPIKGIMENVAKLKCPILVEAKRGKDWDRMEKIS